MFDFHARSTNGMVNENGKITRIILAKQEQVYMHLHSLALSMGYSENVLCNLTGDYGKTTSITDTVSQFESVATTDDAERGSEGEDDELQDDFMILSNEIENFTCVPLNEDVKGNLCKELNVPFMYIDYVDLHQNIEKELT